MGEGYTPQGLQKSSAPPDFVEKFKLAVATYDNYRKQDTASLPDKLALRAVKEAGFLDSDQLQCFMLTYRVMNYHCSTQPAVQEAIINDAWTIYSE